MKKLILGLLAVSTVFAACSDSINESDEETSIDSSKKLYELKINSADLKSRATLNSDYSCDWEVGDGLTVLGSDNSVAATFSVKSVNPDGSAVLTSEDGLSDGAYRVFYPAFTDRTALPDMLSQTQTGATNSHVADNDLMFSNLLTVAEGAADGDLTFTHACALVDFKIKTTGTEETPAKLEKIIITSLTDNWFWKPNARRCNSNNAEVCAPGTMVCYDCGTYSKVITLEVTGESTLSATEFSAKLLAVCLWQTFNTGNLQIKYVTDQCSITETLTTDGVIKGFYSGQVYTHAVTLDVTNIALVDDADLTKTPLFYERSFSFPVNSLETVTLTPQNLQFADGTSVPETYTATCSMSGTTATVTLSERNIYTQDIKGEIVVSCEGRESKTVSFTHGKDVLDLSDPKVMLTYDAQDYTPALTHMVHAYKIVCDDNWVTIKSTGTAVMKAEDEDGWIWVNDYSAIKGTEFTPIFALTENTGTTKRTAQVLVRWGNNIKTITVNQAKNTAELTPLAAGVLAGTVTAKQEEDDTFSHKFTEGDGAETLYSKAQYDQTISTTLTSDLSDMGYEINGIKRYTAMLQEGFYDYCIYTAARPQYPILFLVTTTDASTVNDAAPEGSYLIKITCCEEPFGAGASQFTNEASYYDPATHTIVLKFNFWETSLIDRTITLLAE